MGGAAPPVFLGSLGGAATLQNMENNTIVGVWVGLFPAQEMDNTVVDVWPGLQSRPRMQRILSWSSELDYSPTQEIKDILY